MIPETLGALVAFTVFIVPGVAFEILRERRLPPLQESTLREASRTAMTSALFSLGAGTVLALLHKLGASWFADPEQWLKQGQGYTEEHLGVVAVTAIAFVACSLLLAWGTDLLLADPGRRAVGGLRRTEKMSPWYFLFEICRPKEAKPWIHLRLKGETSTEVWGYLGSFSSDPADPDPQIILTGPSLTYRRTASAEKTALDDWSSVLVRRDDIEWLKVQYLMIEEGGSSKIVPADLNWHPPRSRLRRWLRLHS